MTFEVRWREHAPDWLRRWLRPISRPYCRRRWNAAFRTVTRKETFDRIYAEKTWGGSETDSIYSGEGSHGGYPEHFLSLVEPEIRRRGVKSLVDLGCGDFTIGSLVAPLVGSYVGLDIVEDVIATNQRLHARDGCQFVRADVCTDSLPSADAAIMRQVLQHLSNEEIRAVLDNVLPRYPLLFVTEHLDVETGCQPNIDIPHGPDVRADVGSGVWIDQAPFNVPATTLGDIPFKRTEVLRTWLIETNRC